MKFKTITAIALMTLSFCSNAHIADMQCYMTGIGETDGPVAAVTHVKKIGTIDSEYNLQHAMPAYSKVSRTIVSGSTTMAIYEDGDMITFSKHDGFTHMRHVLKNDNITTYGFCVKV